MIDLVGFSVGGLSKCFCHTSWRRRRWERERRHQRRSERESVVRGGTKPTQLEEPKLTTVTSPIKPPSGRRYLACEYSLSQSSS